MLIQPGTLLSIRSSARFILARVVALVSGVLQTVRVQPGQTVDVSALVDAQGGQVDVSDVQILNVNGAAVLQFPGGESAEIIGANPADLQDPAAVHALGIQYPGATVSFAALDAIASRSDVSTPVVSFAALDAIASRSDVSTPVVSFAALDAIASRRDISTPVVSFAAIDVIRSR